MYKLRNNRFPTTEQGLKRWLPRNYRLIPHEYPEGGFIKRLPEDPGQSVCTN